MTTKGKQAVFICRCIAVYLFLAALGKILEPISAYRVLGFDGIGNAYLQYAGVFTLVIAEATAAMLMLIYPRERKVLYLVSALFLCFLLQLALLIVGHGPNLCGCLGWFAWLLPELNRSAGFVLDAAILAFLLYSSVEVTLRQPTAEG